MDKCNGSMRCELSEVICTGGPTAVLGACAGLRQEKPTRCKVGGTILRGLRAPTPAPSHPAAETPGSLLAPKLGSPPQGRFWRRLKAEADRVLTPFRSCGVGRTFFSGWFLQARGDWSSPGSNRKTLALRCLPLAICGA